jgi:DNA-binding MarR family transcriptional regulator
MLNEFVDCTLQQLKPRQAAVWLCLFRDSRNGIATAAQSYIAQRCGLKRPTVSTTISELEKLGLVTTIHRGGINRGLSRYRVSGLITGG